MKGKERLGCSEYAAEVTDALLALAQSINYLQARFIGQRVEPAHGLLNTFRNQRWHAANISTSLDLSNSWMCRNAQDGNMELSVWSTAGKRAALTQLRVFRVGRGDRECKANGRSLV